MHEHDSKSLPILGTSVKGTHDWCDTNYHLNDRQNHDDCGKSSRVSKQAAYRSIGRLQKCPKLQRISTVAK
jgi:hypothetical protein